MGEPEQYSRKELLHRIGTFFVMVAVGLLVFFILSDSSGAPSLNFFCWGMVLAALGFVFRAQYRRPTASSGRFGWWDKVFKGKKE